MRIPGAQRTRGQGERRTIHGGWWVGDEHGTKAAILAASPCDLDAVSDSQRRQLTAAFADACRSLRDPMQLVIQRRSVLPSDPVEVAWDDLIVRHRSDGLHNSPAYLNRIYCVVTSTALGVRDLERSVTELGARLRAGGVVTTLVSRERLTTLLETPTYTGAFRIAYAPDGGVIQGWRVLGLPGQSVEPGWLRPLFTVATACDIAIHLTPTSASAAFRRLEGRLREHGARHLLDIDRLGMSSAQTDAAMGNILRMRERLAHNEVAAIGASITVVVRSAAGCVDSAAGAVRNALAGVGCTVGPTHFQHAEALNTVRPGGRDTLGSGKLVTSEAAATLLPWVQEVVNDPRGYAVGVTRPGELPLNVDPFNIRHHGNANVGVFAASGAGKSFLLGTLILEAARNGVEVVVVDPEGEHRRSIEAVGGSYLPLGVDSRSALNVLDLCSPGDRTIAVDFIDALTGGLLTPSQRAEVDLVLGAAMEKMEHRPQAQVLLEDCVAPLQKILPDVAIVLQRLCRGPLGPVFNAPTTLRLDAACTGISLRGLPDELISATTLVIAGWIWRSVCDDPRPRHIIFDEVGALDAHPALRKLLVQLARRCRKYQASLVVATQNLSDLLRSTEGSVIASNCAVVFLGGHRSVETALMEQTFALTHWQRRDLENAGRGEFLLLAGSRRVGARVDVPPLYRDILDGRVRGSDILRPPTRPVP